MNRRTDCTRRASLSTACLLACAAAAVSTHSAEAQSAPIRLRALVLDFTSAHPDFGVPAATRHAASVTGVSLDSEDSPMLSGVGFDVDAQWRDSAKHPIPHDYAEFLLRDATLLLTQAPSLDKPATLDTWDPTLGPYSAATAGPTPTVQVGAPMPTITVPSGPAAYAPTLSWIGIGTSTLSQSYRCGSFFLSEQRQLRISGNVLLVVENDFQILDSADLLLDPGATLTVYLLGSGRLQDISTLNANTKDPSRVTIINASTQDFVVQNQCKVYANILSPNGTLVLTDGSDVYGSFTGKSISLQNISGMHALSGGSTGPCYVSDDEVGVRGSVTANMIQSESSFRQWYRLVPGVNAGTMTTLDMTWNNAGYFEHATNDMRPIDGELFGVGGGPNYNFTMEMAAGFVFSDCASQYIEWEGDGEMWIFVNGRRALDVAGPGVFKRQRLDMERLGLADGQFHIVRFYYAQRREASSRFALRTNIGLITLEPGKPTGAQFD